MEGLRSKGGKGKKTAGCVVIDILRETESGKSGKAELSGCQFVEGGGVTLNARGEMHICTIN